jgi:hypothetical protein
VKPMEEMRNAYNILVGKPKGNNIPSEAQM